MMVQSGLPGLRRVASARLGAAFGRPQRAPDSFSNRATKVAAERSPDAFGGAQALDRVAIRRLLEKRAKRREPLQHGGERREPVIPAGEVPRTLDQRQSCARATERARTGLSDT